MELISAIDVSHWQGKIDWKKVKESGIKKAYIKSTQGVGSTDQFCKINAENAIIEGIDIGYYHFASLNTHDEFKDATEEADYFSHVLNTLPSPKLPVVLDIESNKAGLTKDEVLNWIKTFFLRLEANRIMNYAIYSYCPFLNDNLPPNHGLGNIKLWLASYTKTPKLPNGWDKIWIWQYSCDGSVPGVNGRVDLNKIL